MKTLFFLAACLSCTVASHAQTTPTAPATGTTAPVSGTKNVGADRADAPQAPGMSSSGAPRAASTKTSNSTNPRRAAPAKKQKMAAGAQ